MKALLNVWSSIKGYVRNVRIKADFNRCEKTLISARAVEADLRFDTSQLERDIAGIERRAKEAAHLEFGAELDGKQLALKSLAPIKLALKGHIELLQRDFRHELDLLHEEKTKLFRDKDLLLDETRDLQRKRVAVKADLDDAYENLELAKASVESWYRKSDRSQWLFGNSGTKLPSHSLFGQSFGDLDGYKERRDSARRDIGSHKSDMDDIQRKKQANGKRRDANQSELTRLFKRIDAVKHARQSVYDLKQQGVSLPGLKQELSDVLRNEAQLENEFRQSEVVRDAFVVRHKADLGFGERMEAVRRLQTERRQFLALFESANAIAARRETHRQAWVRARGG